MTELEVVNESLTGYMCDFLGRELVKALAQAEGTIDPEPIDTFRWLWATIRRLDPDFSPNLYDYLLDTTPRPGVDALLSVVEP